MVTHLLDELENHYYQTPRKIRFRIYPNDQIFADANSIAKITIILNACSIKFLKQDLPKGQILLTIIN